MTNLRIPVLAVAAAALLAPALPAQQGGAAGQGPARYTLEPRDTLLFNTIAANARTKAVELNASRPADNARAVAQYRQAIGMLERGQFDSAETSLQAVMIRAPGNALYLGDMAFAQARGGNLEEAGDNFARAFQLQQQNAWFIVGVALARGGYRQWAEAAGTIALAAQTDSAVITGPIATAAAGWFEQAGDRANALTWARMAVALQPDEPSNYLRIASNLRSRQDTTPEGLAAIRRYRTMRPDDKLGAALYADYLFNGGQRDSAFVMMLFAAQDSIFQPFASEMYLRAGREQLVRQQPDSAMVLLNSARRWATTEQRPALHNILGRAQLMKANTSLQQYTENSACAPARVADSLINESERNLREGLAFDSARTTSFLETIIPPTKQNAQAAVRNCRENPAPARRPARPAPPPARRP